MISNRYIKELAKTAIEKDGTVNITENALNGIDMSFFPNHSDF